MRTPPRAEPKKSSSRWIILGIIVVLLLSATVGWAMWHREDPQVTRVKELRDQLEELPREKRREAFGQMREEMEKLTPEQREAVFADRRAEWERREKERMREFFALPKEQQIAALDKDIDRMKEWMKSRKDRGDRGRGDRGRGGFGGGNGGGGQRPQSFGRDPNGNVGASARTKGYLDKTDPDTRAQRNEYRRMMAQRMTQRGGR